MRLASPERRPKCATVPSRRHYKLKASSAWQSPLPLSCFAFTPNLTVNVEAPVFCTGGVPSSSDVCIGVPTGLEAGVTASDFGNNAGLILGNEIAGWRERLSDLTCTMSLNDVVIGRGGAAAIPGGPLDSLAFLLNLLHRRGRRLEAGQLISTGAATGVHDILAGQAAVADFGPDGHIDCIAVPATGAIS